MTDNNTRKNIRFIPDENTLIEVTLPDGRVISGPAFSESYNGCAGVFLAYPELKQGLQVKIKVGNLAENLAEIRWTKRLGDKALEIGFQIM